MKGRSADHQPSHEPDHDRQTATPRVLEAGAAWGWRFLVVVASVFVVGWLLVQLRVVIIPVFVAVIVAALLVPLVDLADRRMPRLLAVWVVFMLVVAAVAVIVFLLQSPVRSAITELTDSWDSARDDLREWLRTGPLDLDQSQIDTLSERANQVRQRFTSGFFESASGAARMAAEVVAGFFLTLVLVFFFVKDGRQMWRWGLERVNPHRKSALDRGGRAAFAALQGWIRGIAITGVVDGLLIGIALVILGVPAAIPLAVITAIAAFFPIVGATLAGGLATVIAFATQGPQTGIIVAVVVLVVQQVEGDILLPIVMYRQVALHPVVVLLVLAIGGAIGGILGAIVSVPLTAALTAAVAAARRPDDDAAAERVDGSEETSPADA